MANISRKNEKNITLPILAMRGIVCFPGVVMQFDVGRKKSVAAVTEALSRDKLIFLVTQTDLSDDDPSVDNLYRVGVIAKIKQVMHRTEEGIKLHVEGVSRGEIVDIMFQKPYIRGTIEKKPDPLYKNTYKTKALIRVLHEKFDEYAHLFRRLSPDILLGVLKRSNCGELSDYVASNIALSYENKQLILDEYNPVKRLKKLVDILVEENKILAVENEINLKTQEQIDANQRDYYLKEQMRAIAIELGEDDSPQEEADEIKQRINDLKLAPICHEKLMKECNKLYKMPFGSHEASIIRVYLDTCLSMPWNTYSNEKLDIEKAAKILNRDHYGLEKVKERFLEILAVRKLAPAESGQIICLVGPPGVGKTSIAYSIAEAIGRKYVRVSLGGVSDESEIMGHRKTYVGSMPGRIINAIKQAGTNNPLVLLDEIDKLGQNFKGDPASALLEVLDPEQNGEFTDHYMDMPYSLKDVLFITTANDASRIPGPLYDRMEVIELGSYTLDEKANIAMKHLVKKQLKKHGIKAAQMKISKAAIISLIEGYTREAGVRNLERRISALCRKVAKKIVSEPEFKTISIKPGDLETLLGPRKYSKDEQVNKNTVGLVNGLAWTSVGGEMLPIEVAVMPGTGKIQLTGSLGDVMKESASAAITCIRTRANNLGISPDFYEKLDIHIHAPEGAVPKDGPSAGIAMATAITSALTEVPVLHEVAMTGEITLQGRVLPIGGLREKSMAAYKHGIKVVLIPSENEPDLAEVDAIVRENITFIPVSVIDTVLERALDKVPKSNSKKNPIIPKPSRNVSGKSSELFQ